MLLVPWTWVRQARCNCERTELNPLDRVGTRPVPFACDRRVRIHHEWVIAERPEPQNQLDSFRDAYSMLPDDDRSSRQ